MPGTADKPDVVRLGDLDDLAAAVPYLLGFHPRDSLVAVALKGPRERISFTARLDLPDGPEDNTAVADYLAQSMQRAGAESVLLFVFTAAPEPGGVLPAEALVDEVVRRLPVPAREALLVTDDRVWSYLCPDQRCCPSEGRPRRETPAQATLAAAHALHGRAVLPDREGMVASLAPIGGIAEVSLDAALDAATEEFLAAGRDAYRDRMTALLDDRLKQYDDPRASLSHDDAARLVIGSHDIRFRDLMVGRCLTDAEPMRLLLTHLVRLALPPLDAPVCTVAAIASYLTGDGAVALTLLDRAFGSDPSYSLAEIVDHVLRCQLEPDDLRRALQGFLPGPKRSRRRRR